MALIVSPIIPLISFITIIGMTRKMKISPSRKLIVLLVTAMLVPLLSFNVLYVRPIYDPVAIDSPRSIEDFKDQLEMKLSSLLETNTVPGAAIALISDNQTHIITGGKANIWSNQPITSKSSFQIASMSKTQCAFAIMKLVQEGRIHLDAPVEWYLTRWFLPDSDYNSSGVTARRILCHAAGLSLEGVPTYLSEVDVPSIEDALTASDVQLIYEPGSVFSYSGGGYGILQLLIEEVSGVSYEEFMQSEIFTPLGLSDTFASWDNEITGQLAVGYSNMLLPVIQTYSTIDDMAKWAHHLLSGQSVVNTSYMINMFTPQWGEDWGWTLGLNYRVLENNRLILGHGGDNWGYHGAFRICPETGNAIVILTNGDRGAAFVSELLYYWEQLIGEQTIHDPWIHSNQLYTQLAITEIAISCFFIFVLGVLIYKGKIVFAISATKSVHKRNRITRVTIAAASILFFGILVIYWGYTSLSSISYGSTGYILPMVVPLLWLACLSVMSMFSQIHVNLRNRLILGIEH